MTKKDLVALAGALRIHNRMADGRTEFTPDHLVVLADFCALQYPNFDRKRWIDYITEESGQDDEWIFADPDSRLIGEDKPVARGNRDEGNPKSGQRRPSVHS
jgi:hypothetical protein